MKKLVKVLLVLVIVCLFVFSPLGVGRQDPPKYPDDRPISYINSVNPKLF